MINFANKNMRIFDNITEFIGKTPLLKLHAEKWGFEGNLYVKMESFNPGGSVKDRLSYAMLNDAQQKGILTPKSIVIEPSSGNTGIGLAMVAATLGIKIIITMPESVSLERRALIKAYGAELVLTPADKGMKGAIAKAEELSAETEHSFIPMQFANPANSDMHRRTTGPEIWNDTEGTIDIFVAGVGTGGTITGAGEYLRSQKPDLKIIAVEPEDSPVLSGGTPQPHKIQGIGPGFIPEILNTSIYDEIILMKTTDAIETALMLARTEGILCGISSGANVFASLQVLNRPENSGKTVVTVICDTGERYLSTVLFQND
jgi:cysteine synthase A